MVDVAEISNSIYNIMFKKNHFQLMYKIKVSNKISWFILLWNLVLIILMIENTHSIVIVETGRLSAYVQSLYKQIGRLLIF